MLKLLQQLPEIMIVLRAIATASRTVFVTMFLLIIICYVFAIFFTQMSRGTILSSQYFGSVGQSLSTLLLTGAFPDQYDIMTEAAAESYVFWFPLLVFITLSAVTIMNMMIGVLVEVVKGAAHVEGESLMARTLQDVILKALYDKPLEQVGEADLKMLLSKQDFLA